MGIVTSHTTLDSLRRVLEHPRSLFVGVTGDALLLFESAESQSSGRPVRIVAVDTLDDPFLESVPFVVLKGGGDVLVTLGTLSRASGDASDAKKPCSPLVSARIVSPDMYRMTARAAQSNMGASPEFWMCLFVTAHAFANSRRTRLHP